MSSDTTLHTTALGAYLPRSGEFWLMPTSGMSLATSTTASELLWPVIHKGVAHVPVAMVGTAWTRVDCVTRALSRIHVHFLLFSKLPDPKDGLHPDVLEDLVHYTLFGLQDKVYREQILWTTPRP